MEIGIRLLNEQQADIQVGDKFFRFQYAEASKSFSFIGLTQEELHNTLGGIIAYKIGVDVLPKMLKNFKMAGAWELLPPNVAQIIK